MNIKSTSLKLILFIFTIALSLNNANGQAKNALGFGPALNVSGEGMGIGARLQGEIKINRKIAIVPAIGLEVPYFAYAGISGKYYFQPRFYGMLGILANIASLDTGDQGIGGSAALGYELVSSRKHILDLNLHGDTFTAEGEAAGVAGLRLTYNFSFSGK